MAEQPIPPAPSPAPRPFYKQIDFWLGFIGWYVVNGLIWWEGGGFDPKLGPAGNIFMLPANLVVLLITAFVRRRFAGGMLVAVVINFFIAIVVGATMNAACAIPFFIR